MGKNHRKSISGSMEERHLYVERLQPRGMEDAGRKAGFASAG